ncbi:universal stress protein [Streptomyces aureus]|uniref:universal stress protein n=1 Tax=Streptomyces aureus TaxID=193461 RepID=UPI00056641F6|nr:universal stress protein [Streptomyces aureus]
MPRTVTVGLDGSLESRAAAAWAAREAALRDLPLKLVHVWEPVPEPMAQASGTDTGTRQHRSERSEMRVPPAEGRRRIPREAAEAVRQLHPELEVVTEQLPGRPADVLVQAAEDAELLVLGSRGLGGLGGFMVGSVGLSVVARVQRPVVLVRAPGQAADEPATHADGASIPVPPVVLGLDVEHPDEALIAFAFEAARRRETSLRVVHTWYPPPYYAYGTPVNPALHEALALSAEAELEKVLSPWRTRFPDVEVAELTRYGSPADHLVKASQGAALIVVGRNARHLPLGAHIGHTTHSVLHHAGVPVAVVPHD